MLQVSSIGLAGGAASALLFASIASGSLLSFPLFYLAPLPILIAGLGWGTLAGLIAALSAGLALAALFGGYFFLGFLLGIGLPAWWLSYLALLARPAGPDQVDWYPVGRLLAWTAGLASATGLLMLLWLGSNAEALRALLQEILDAVLRPDSGVQPEIKRSAQAFLGVLTRHLDIILPPSAAFLTTIVTVFTLWLAGRVVRISGRLPRPWPDLTEVRLPVNALPVLAVALAGVFLLGGPPRVVALVVATALLSAYGLIGLAIIHTVTRRFNGRGFILTATYLSLIFFSWPMLLFSALGLADVAFDLRARIAGRPFPPSST